MSLNNIPTLMQWLSYVAYVRYGFEGTMLAIYSFDRAPPRLLTRLLPFQISTEISRRIGARQGSVLGGCCHPNLVLCATQGRRLFRTKMESTVGKIVTHLLMTCEKVVHMYSNKLETLW